MGLEGFETVTFGITGMFASITRNGVTFSKNVVQRIGSPPNVILMINKERKQFAIKPAGQKDASAMPFFSAEKGSPSVRWNSKEFLKLISGMMNWDLKASNGYRVNGSYVASDKAIIFDLCESIPNP